MWSGTLVSMASHYSYAKQLMDNSIYGIPVKVEYEGRLLFAPQKTDEYLTRIYKNYMQLPPENERWETTNFVERVDYGEGE